MINHIILFLIQLSHWIFLVLAGVSVPLLLICEPFYISFPICSWIMHLAFSRTLDCPWTRLENKDAGNEKIVKDIYYCILHGGCSPTRS